MHWADRPHVMHAMRARTRCAALAEAGVLVPKLTAGQVGWWHAFLSASCAGQGTHLAGCQRAAALARRRPARFAPLANDFRVVPSMAEAFSSR